MEPYRWIKKIGRRNTLREPAVVEAVPETVVKPLSEKKGMEQWAELRGMLMRVLRRFPEAMAAVLVGVKQILGETCEPEPAAT